MNRVMAIVASVIVVVIGLVLAPTVLSAVHDTGSDSTSEVFAVSTGVGQTTATVTLAKAHFHDDTTHMSATSDNANDTPTVQSYDPNTRQVTVGGLVESATRNLTVHYEIAALAQFSGADAILKLVPLLYIVGLLGLAGGILFRTLA